MRLLRPCCTLPARFAYLRFDVDFAVPVRLEPYQIQALIQTALRSLCGQIGSANLLVDLLEWESNETRLPDVNCIQRIGSGLLRTESETAAMVWAALTILSSFDNKACRVLVKEAAHFPLALTPGA
jgi:RNase P/RNase MRP subunit POP5